MTIFEITSSNRRAMTVIANDYDEAVGIYMIHWFAGHETELSDIEVKRRNLMWPGLDADLLATAMESSVSGVAQFDPDTGWTVVSPAYSSLEDEA